MTDTTIPEGFFALHMGDWGFIPANGPLYGKRVTPEVKVGDFVLFGKWSGTEVKVEGQELLIMKESDIMGIVEGRTKSGKKAA